MKFWVDAQLPPTLAAWLSGQYGVEVIALRDLGLRDGADIEILHIDPKSTLASGQSPATRR
ncbi:MAG: DUF5615 family PIN-like protein [Sulfuritalea sp.]|nr:DUF5615 family PIN-like protein [Sulfuritalea sp.]